MKKAKLGAVSVFILTLSALTGCSVMASSDGESQQRDTVEAAVSFQMFSDRETEKKHDTTEFLVGEFYVNNGSVACFDGRGVVTVISPDGASRVGSYSMRETHAKDATVTINFGQGEEDYSYSLISANGDFSLSDASDELLVFVLKTYE